MDIDLIAFKLAPISLSSSKSSVSGAECSDFSDSSQLVKRRQVTFQECRALPNEVQVLSKSLIKCSWASEKDLGRGAKRHFVPASLEDAKRLLRNSVESLTVKMQRIHICHGCHATLGNGTHQGSAIGKAKCIFPHSVLCKGGISENESWRACPEGYIFNPDVDIQSYSGFTETLDPSGFHPGILRRSTPAGSSHSLEDQNTVLQIPILQSQPSQVDGAGSITNDESERLDRLRRQASGEGARARTNLVNENTSNSSGPAQVQNNQGSNIGTDDLPPHILAQIQDFRSRNQASNQAVDRPVSDFNIGHLRSNQGLREQVEVGMNEIRQQIPSLAAAPSANLGSHMNQDSQLQSLRNINDYERRMDQRNEKQHSTPYYYQRNVQFVENNQLRTPFNSQGQSNRNSTHVQISPERDYYHHQNSHREKRFEYRCSPTSGRVWQVEVPIGPDHQDQTPYKIEYRCSPTSGRVWKERIPLSPLPRQSYHLEWRIHPHTGEAYQIEVPSLNSQTHLPKEDDRHPLNYSRPIHGRSDIGFPSTHASAPKATLQSVQQQYTTLQDQNGQQHAYRNGDVTGISRLGKNNTKKNSKMVDLARLCPVKWAKTTTSNTINLPLYTWAIVSELESSLSGRGDQFSEQEMLGKIRHLKNVAEVCCLNSNSTDFSSYGWAIARDYALKVEDEVAQGLASWSEMHHGVRTNSLLLAQMDCSRQSFQKTAKTRESDKDKLVCTTYNKCTTKGKCEYEVTNPDRTCQRKHECSWCRSNLGQSYKHQAIECNKRKEATGSS